MPNSLQSSAIGSPASRRATNCSLSSIAEHSFQGIGSPPSSGRKCHLCVRYDVLPMSQAAHKELPEVTPETPTHNSTHKTLALLPPPIDPGQYQEYLFYPRCSIQDPAS